MSRSASRIAPAGTAQGHDLVRECLAINRPGRYQILAAINAVHTDAPTASDTDWSQVVALYDQLTRLDPSPIVALNHVTASEQIGEQSRHRRDPTRTVRADNPATSSIARTLRPSPPAR